MLGACVCQPQLPCCPRVLLTQATTLPAPGHKQQNTASWYCTMILPLAYLVHVVRLLLPLQLLDIKVVVQGARSQPLVGRHHVDPLQQQRRQPASTLMRFKGSRPGAPRSAACWGTEHGCPVGTQAAVPRSQYLHIDVWDESPAELASLYCFLASAMPPQHPPPAQPLRAG